MSRIILKFSGEALKEGIENVSNNKLNIIYKVVNNLVTNGHKVAVVIGGGNFFRGREYPLMDRVTADTIGMLGTIMNALYLKDYLRTYHMESIVSTPFTFPGLINDYSTNELIKMYNEDKVIIFGGGIGKSGYSTDSGVIKACDILNGDLIIKMTNVNGVYDSDPKENKDAILYNSISYDEVLNKDLKVMDRYSIEECKKKSIKILVMNIDRYNDILDYFNGKNIGTIIGE